MFIQTEETPNPLSIKFYPECEVLSKGSVEFSRNDDYSISPLASILFSIDEVERVFLGKNFITVTKNKNADWEELQPQILGVIMEHFSNSDSVVIHASFYSNDNIEKTQSEIEQKIMTILDTRIRPAVARDGGDIEFCKYEDGVVYIYLRGACSGCPGAKITLKNGVERILREYIPEVTSVEALNFKD